ncbi:3-hydroxyacyl-CoA dehydrogenase family protein [Bacillus sp. CCB-MMP212]|uniref:3-hydroxyacyl-CoA dehydrogenase family protein n=1 Tax=Bacillus TaxID=1386 RepID=UPI0018CF563A|nr:MULTISPECIES: 3-hydroxyacyl-CoA dehydrogenase family protein [Bacillus]MBG9713060.1 3-hydroxybutyryl-CoA dehydrogenase [Bacillus cereus]MCI4251252.1 3-hydroxyacyl-CoA dehydrogenase family protein [Bacillus sp. CCB-MMP212]
MFKKIGIVGAGTMGIGMAVDLVLHGLETVLIDVTEEQLNKAEEKILETVRFAPLINKAFPRMHKEEVLSLISSSTNLDEVAECDYIVENVPENWQIKEPIYRRLDEICKKDTIFGVNTSCISITKVGGVTKRPDKIIGMHFMNPVYMKPSIEVIRGHLTSDETVEKAQSFLKQLDKDAIVVNDQTGFVSNRISHLFMNESAWVVMDGVATPKQVDDIFKKCFGHTMGPLETADLIGLDTVLHSLNVLYEEYQDPKFRCCPLLKKMVDAGECGRKSGKGFYAY